MTSVNNNHASSADQVRNAPGRPSLAHIPLVVDPKQGRAKEAAGNATAASHQQAAKDPAARVSHAKPTPRKAAKAQPAKSAQPAQASQPAKAQKVQPDRQTQQAQANQTAKAEPAPQAAQTPAAQDSSPADRPKRRSVKGKAVTRRTPDAAKRPLAQASQPSPAKPQASGQAGPAATAAAHSEQPSKEAAPVSNAPSEASAAPAVDGANSPASADSTPPARPKPVVRAGGKLKAKTAAPAKPLTTKGIALRVLAGVAACAVVALAGFALMRGPFSNDAQAIQGTWVGENAENAVVITQDRIDLAGQATYTYQLDAGAKCLQLQFNEYSGYAQYRLSADGTRLAIMDVAAPNAVGAFFDDLAWAAADLLCSMQGTTHSLLSKEGTELTRAANAKGAAAQDQQDGKQAEASAAEGAADQQGPASAQESAGQDQSASNAESTGQSSQSEAAQPTQP